MQEKNPHNCIFRLSAANCCKIPRRWRFIPRGYFFNPVGYEFNPVDCKLNPVGWRFNAGKFFRCAMIRIVAKKFAISLSLQYLCRLKRKK
jgi:hypothetical protein